MAQKRHRIVAIGDNCIDFYLKSGEAFPGGNPVNVAVYVKRLGHDASYIGVVGDDANGCIIRDALSHKGVDMSHLHIEGGRTAITEVIIENGERIFGDYDEGVMAHFRLNEEDLKFAGTHDLMISGIWGKIESDLPRLKASGKPIAFDFADKMTHPIVEQALPYVDFAFFASEAVDLEQIKAQMIELKAKTEGLIIVTRGALGSVVFDGKQFVTHGIVACEVVDTMGAGDSYIAGFLCAALSKHAISDCMSAGAKNSSVTIQYKGAW